MVVVGPARAWAKWEPALPATTREKGRLLSQSRNRLWGSLQPHIAIVRA